MRSSELQDRKRREDDLRLFREGGGGEVGGGGTMPKGNVYISQGQTDGLVWDEGRAKAVYKNLIKKSM